MRAKHLEPCAVCGVMVAQQGNKMHERSKTHQAALKALEGTHKTEVPPPELNEIPGPTEINEPITQKLDIKQVPPITKEQPHEPNKVEQKEEEWRGFFPDD